MQLIRKTDADYKDTVFRYCFYITLISNLVIYIAMPLNINVLEAFASRCFMLTNLFAFLYAVNFNIRNYMPYKTNQIVLITLMVVFTFASYLSSGGVGAYQYVIHLWSYLALPFYLLYIDFIKPDRFLIHFVFGVNYLISIIFILFSFCSFKYRGYEHYIGTESAYITLGYKNANQIAMYLLITFFVLICTLLYYNNRILRSIVLLTAVYIGFILYQTHSRTCIIIAFLYTVVILLKRKLQISELSVILIMLFPLLFIPIYRLIYELGLLRFEYMGKTDYISRYFMYEIAISTIKGKWFFGNYSLNQLGNHHNGPISILVSWGISGLFFFYLYFCKAYLYLRMNYLKSRTSFAAFMGLLSVFLHACTESAFMTAGSMYAGSISMLIFLVKLDGKEVQNH